MAKEKFVRNKPHVNIGTTGYTKTLVDTAGQLTIGEDGAESSGNPAPSSLLSMSAPMSSAPQTAIVAFPIDDYFRFDPISSGPALSIDFQLDVLPLAVGGTDHVDITLAILQDNEAFIVSRAGGSPSVDGAETDWTTLGQADLLPENFLPVDGGTERVDFNEPFQFGYAFTGEYSTTALAVELGLDNMQVEITTVPEPTSIAMAVAMGAALLWSRWWGGDENPRE